MTDSNSHRDKTEDVSKRQNPHEHHLQARKMESLGQLAGGVARDFNNLLTVISGYSELLWDRLAADASGRELLAEIQKAAQRGAALTGQLLAFSRQSPAQARPVDLSELVRQAAVMLGRLLGPTICLDTRLEPNAPAVRADPTQLEQVLLNLALHACDAMPQGGQLALRTVAVTLNEAAARHRPSLRSGRYVLLSVSNAGNNRSEQAQAHLLEPSFTTKPVNGDTGLHLAGVAEMVRQSGGFLEMDSTADQGATFILYLPCWAEAPTALEPASAPALPCDGETILLAEETADLAIQVRQILDRGSEGTP
jgi:two-component system cell cycle sensor histidine kinase/response regulator CckA